MQCWSRILSLAKENRTRILTMLILGCLPVLLGVMYCAACGGSLSDVFLPASYWNDELFYYKQTDGILRAGYPLGYFGYNESHARMLSFGYWCPLVFLPWTVWGLLFGWNLNSVVLCNLVCVVIGIMAFAWLAQPDFRQTCSIALLVGLFTPFTRFVLSSVVEYLFLSVIFVYAGLFFAYARNERKCYLNGMLILSVFLTILRPYYLSLVLLPVFLFQSRGSRWKLKFLGGGLLGMAGYFLSKYCLSAEYLFIEIGGGFLGVLKQEGIAVGIRAFGTQTLDAADSLIRLLKDAVRYGNEGGCFYGVFGILGVFFLLIAMREWKGQCLEKARGAVGMAGVYVFLMAAIVYMYDIHNGDRHLMAFILLGLLFLGMYSGRKMGIVLKVFISAVLIFFYFIKPGTDYERQVPFTDDKLKREIVELKEELEEKMALSEKLSWNNTVIWLAYDIVDEEIVAEQWQQLYALPAGFGINHCSQNYVMDNFDNINSRYIAAIPGGEIEKKLEEGGALRLAGNTNIAIWDRSTIK